MATTDEIAERLASVDLFRDVSPKVRKRIAGAGKVLDFAPGFEVTTEASGGVAFHLVLSGSADVEVHGEHRRVLGPGNTFGEISLIDGEPRSATVRATAEGLRTFALTSWAFLPILDENPTVARAMLKVLCTRIRAIEAATHD